MMNNIFKFTFIFAAVACLIYCKKEPKQEPTETILKGKINILVDETLVPLVEEQIAVFESTYDAKITIIAKSEAEVMQDFISQKTSVALLAKKPNEKELSFFEKSKIVPRVTPFAKDAIAFVTKKNNKDSLIALSDVITFMHGKAVAGIKGMVFDNPNSSTVRYVMDLSGTKTLPQKNVYSFKTNNDVIKFVSQNEGIIGVVGLNWVTDPLLNMKKHVDNICLMSVKGLKAPNYYSPNQNDIAEGTYPLARDLYIVNAQGYTGLGMGFASFIAGEIGQRIVLKSGLLPNNMPGRKLKIRNKINNDKQQ